MAPAPVDTLSPPGSSSYTSDTLTVGDGTWDFTKNTFLLPNLVGLNFDTMRYNGMANRFSTLTQYHSLITAHGVLAAITFLFLIPIAVLIARFHTSSPGYAVRYHAYLQVLAVGLSTVVFALGFFAVGPPRSLTNPHHGIGVAIYVLILLQAIGGRLVKHIRGRSFRVHVHRWSGRVVTLLGIVQVPLGLTLYGSPKYLFVLFAVWMGFLVLLYFVLDYRDQGRHEYLASGGRSDGGRRSEKSDRKSGVGWFAKIAAALGVWALFRGRKSTRDTERGLSRSPSPARSHRGRNLGPEVISSPRQSESYYEEKHTERRASGGGFMKKVFGVGAGLGAGALVGKMLSGRNRGHDDEYSAVATDTPSRVRKPRRYEPSETEFSGRTEETHHHDGRQGRAPLLPAPGVPPVVAENRPPRPVTPQRSHAATSRFESIEGSDYSSYVSPSRRASEKRRSGGAGVSKGLLAGIGLGWLAKKGKDSRDRREEDRLRDEEDRRRDEEDDRRAGKRSSRYTADGYPSPSRRESRRRPPRARPPPSAITNTASILSDESSIEPRGDTFYEPAPVGVPRPMQPAPAPSAAPIPLIPAGSQMPVPVPGPPPPGGYGSRSQSRVRQDASGPATMPAMPADPQGFNHESGSETYYSSGGRPHRRHSSRHGAAGDGTAAAAAAAAAAAGLLAQEEEERRRRDRSRGGESSAPKPVSIKMKMHDKDRNITLRRLTEEETAARRSDRRRRNDSVSSHSDGDTPTRYRRERERESSQRRAEAAAEQRVETEPLEPLSPPNPAFAQGRRPAGKDSAYYSGQPGPSGGVPAAGATVSSLGIGGAGGAGSGGSHGAWSAMSPTPSAPLRDPSASAASAADRRRRRRLERRDGSRTQPGTVDFE